MTLNCPRNLLIAFSISPFDWWSATLNDMLTFWSYKYFPGTDTKNKKTKMEITPFYSTVFSQVLLYFLNVLFFGGHICLIL